MSELLPHDCAIPTMIRIGLISTGGDSDQRLLRKGISSILKRIDSRLNKTPYSVVIISSLTDKSEIEVSDEIFQQFKGKCRVMFKPVLPLPKDQFLQKFSDTIKQETICEILNSTSSFTGLNESDNPKLVCQNVRNYIVRHCDILVIIWSGINRNDCQESQYLSNDLDNFDCPKVWIHSDSGAVDTEQAFNEALESYEHLNAYNSETIQPSAFEAAAQSYTSLLEKNLGNTGLKPNLLYPLYDHLIPVFIRADLLANRYNTYHMRGGIAIYTMATCAVAAVSLQMLFFPGFTIFGGLELLCISVILCLIWLSRKGKWHKKWLDYRYLAERIRSAIFLSLICETVRIPNVSKNLSLAHRPDDWMVGAMDWIIKQKPTLDCNYLKKPGNFQATKRFLTAAWIDDQIQYYKTKSQTNAKQSKVLIRAGEFIFIVTFIASLLSFISLSLTLSPTSPSVYSILTALSIVLPVLGGSVTAIRTHREFHRNSERFRHMAYHLSQIQRDIDHADSWERLKILVDEADEMMLREHQDWRVVFRFHDIEVP